MTLVEIIILAVGLSMDAFAVSVTNGMTKKNVDFKWTVAIAACFGIFQGLMPTIGYFLGSTFTQYITRFDHYVALVLLGFIGGKMLIDGLKKDDDCDCNASATLTVGALLMQGIATSIDALAVGVSFAAVMDSMALALSAAAVITVTTFAFCLAGVYIGKKFGCVLNNKAQIVGGLILIAIGVKIFVEHVFFS